MATFQMPSHFLESRNKYIGGRIKRNLQNQEICYLYSQEGTRFQISKVRIRQNWFGNILYFLSVGYIYSSQLSKTFYIIFRLYLCKLKDYEIFFRQHCAAMEDVPEIPILQNSFFQIYRQLN